VKGVHLSGRLSPRLAGTDQWWPGISAMRLDRDGPGMPALGLFREVMHEKLSDGQLRWEGNDLIDMMYLTAAAGYCDYVVSEHRHGAYITNASQRLGRTRNLHRSLHSLVQQL
jgi:hypothetical protein